MTESPARLEARLAYLERTLAEIERRLEAIEGATPSRSVMQAAEARAEAPAVAAAGADLVGTLSLVGRTLVIFAGAYLLRALTESGSLGHAAGAALGLAYAVFWTLVAWRVAPRHALSATFFGACTVLIAFPLLWEATTRFALLTPAAGVLALTAITSLVLATAWQRQLQPLAWVVTAGACVLASLLLVMTGATTVYTSFLIALGVATLWLGYDREWIALRWLTAAFADAAVLGLAGRALTTPPRDAPSLVMAVQLLLLVGYLGSIAMRTLVRGRNVVPFEMAQTGAMLLAGLAGAMLVAHQTGTGAAALGSALLALALGSYAVAFAFVDRQQGRGANFYFYTALALVFALTGSELVLRGAALGLLWASLAVLAGWAGRRYGRSALTVHSVVYVVAAALASGLVTSALTGLFASPAAAWPPVGAVAWLVLVGIVLCRLLSTEGPARAATLSHWTLAVLAAVSLAGVSVVVARSVLPLEPGASHAGMVATLRTSVLAAAALAVAWLGRRPATHEFGALLYLVLGWGGLKLLLEDFRMSPPSLLFIALALYGGALILGPRIARGRATTHS